MRRLIGLACAIALLLAIGVVIAGGGEDDGRGDRVEAKKPASPDEGIEPIPFGKPVDLPEGAVAVVGDDVITRKAYNQMADAYARDGFRTIAVAHSLQRKCDTFVANMFLPPKKRTRPFPDELPMAECARRYEALKEMQNGPRAMKEMNNGPPAMRMLLQVAWIEREAREQGVSATLGEARRSLRKRMKRIYPTRESYRRFMRVLRPYERRLAFTQYRMYLQQTQLLEKRKKAQRPLTEEDVRRYYRENAKLYRIPERRTVEYVRLDKQGDADKAKRALRGGGSFKAAGRRLSSIITPDCCSISISADDASSSADDDSQTFKEAAMAAEEGRLMGPLGTVPGWYVFKVVEIIPESRQPLDTVRRGILESLRARRDGDFMPSFIRDMHRDYRKVTKCDPKLAVPMCGNGSKPDLQ